MESEQAPSPIPFLRVRLSLQMLLQFAIWGAWAPVLSRHLDKLGFSGAQIGNVFGTSALATMISPLIAGQIADRWFPTQLFLSISYIITGVLFFIARHVTDYPRMWWLGFGIMLFFAPTLGLANSMCFHHLKDARRDFPVVRLFGTIGWILAGVILTGCMKYLNADVGDCLTLAGVFCILNGIYVLTLPSTPPRREAAEKFAVGKVLAMLKDPSFFMFSLLAFGLMLFATQYYVSAGIFFPAIGVSDQNLPLVMSTGQVMEILTMLILPFALRKLGSKLTIAIGLAAWAVRYFLFATGQQSLAIGAQSIHGVAFAFAIAAAMIYAERVCAPDVRGSMQSFLSFLTYGLGMFAGAILGGSILQRYTVDKVTDWHGVWTIEAIGCTAVLALFLIGFKARDEQPQASAAVAAPS